MRILVKHPELGNKYIDEDDPEKMAELIDKISVDGWVAWPRTPAQKQGFDVPVFSKPEAKTWQRQTKSSRKP